MRASIGTFMLVALAGGALAVSAFAGCGGTTVGTGGGATTSTTSTTGTGGKSTGGSGGMGTGGGLPEGKCRLGEDCKGGEQCLPPGTPAGCGACITPPSQCTNDAECAAMGASTICDPAHCACQGEKTCQVGCTSSASCGVGETCEADHRCKPSICAQQIDCPVNFICPPTFNSRCERRTCKVDPECDVGYCVEGYCFDVPGNCTLPVP